MFFDSPNEIEQIAKNNNTSIFVIPKDQSFELKNALVLQPEEKSIITIEQVRNLIAHLGVKQSKDQFVIIRPADKLGLEAANAFLKNLEEPQEKVHFLLITDSLSEILPTILSRSAIYILRKKDQDLLKINLDDKTKDLAKRLMVAKPAELVPLAEEITAKKDGVREYTLKIVDAAIEMLYKSYFITKNQAFLKKLPRFLKLYENLSKNGHIKLQIVACLS